MQSAKTRVMCAVLHNRLNARHVLTTSLTSSDSAGHAPGFWHLQTSPYVVAVAVMHVTWCTWVRWLTCIPHATVTGWCAYQGCPDRCASALGQKGMKSRSSQGQYVLQLQPSLSRWHTNVPVIPAYMHRV